VGKHGKRNKRRPESDAPIAKTTATSVGKLTFQQITETKVVGFDLKNKRKKHGKERDKLRGNEFGGKYEKKKKALGLANGGGSGGWPDWFWVTQAPQNPGKRRKKTSDRRGKDHRVHLGLVGGQTAAEGKNKNHKTE